MSFCTGFTSLKGSLDCSLCMGQCSFFCWPSWLFAVPSRSIPKEACKTCGQQRNSPIAEPTRMSVSVNTCFFFLCVPICFLYSIEPVLGPERRGYLSIDLHTWLGIYSIMLCTKATWTFFSFSVLASWLLPGRSTRISICNEFQCFFCGWRPLPFGGLLTVDEWYHFEPYPWTSRDSNHHRQSVCAVKNGALPTEPRGRLQWIPVQKGLVCVPSIPPCRAVKSVPSAAGPSFCVVVSFCVFYCLVVASHSICFTWVCSLLPPKSVQWTLDLLRTWPWDVGFCFWFFCSACGLLVCFLSSLLKPWLQANSN